MIKENLKQLITQAIKQLALENHWLIPKDFKINLVLSEQVNQGDYNSPVAFELSRLVKVPPFTLAQQLALLMSQQLSPLIEKIEAVPPGYLNFFLKPLAFQNELKNLPNLISFHNNSLSSQTIIVEYSSPNIAKPMHIGHLRSTIIGDALANLYQILGYQVIRWNYLGDWGTQFGKLIVAYKLWGNKKLVQKDPINNLLFLYQKFHQEVKKKPELEQLAQQEFKKLEEGDKTNKQLWLWFKKESLKEFQKIYRMLGIKFNVVKGESDFEKDLQPLIQKLKKKKIAKISQGALIIPLDKYQLPPALIQKSDGATLYLTRDLANLIYRLKTYHPTKILYVVGSEQELYFKQLFAVAQLLKLAPQTQLEHIKFGLILDQNGKKFSTREGELIPLEDVIEKATQLTLKIVAEKHPNWPQTRIKQLAQTLAVGALKFNDLKSYRLADLTFNWQQMLDFKGNSSVYLQYTYARFHKILKQAKSPKRNLKVFLEQPLEKQLIKQLAEFPSVLEKSASQALPHLVAGYLLNLADLLNNYYETVPILKEPELSQREARLLLVKNSLSVLKTGLQILGLRALTEI